jgi:hypothetical protein
MKGKYRGIFGIKYLKSYIYIQRIYIYLSCENYHTFWPVRVLSIFQTLLKSEIVNKLISYEGIIDLIDKVCLWLVTGQWFSPGTLVSSTNKTDHHDITEILLKCDQMLTLPEDTKYLLLT